MAIQTASACTIKLSAPAATLTAEACSLVSGKTYRITDAAKRLINPNAAVTWLDNGGAVSAANIASWNYLAGTVTFEAAYTVTGPVTVTGQYLPLVSVATATSVSLNISPVVQTATVIGDTAQARKHTLLDCSGSLNLNEVDMTLGASTLHAYLQAGTPLVIEIYAPTRTYRALVILETEALDVGSPDALVTDTLSFSGHSFTPVTAKGTELQIAKIS